MNFKTIIHITLFLFITPLPAASQSESQKFFDTFTIYWENDFFAGSDRDYTNGLKLTWGTPYLVEGAPRRLPGWSLPVINRLPSINNPKISRAVSFGVGHEIYTPTDTYQSDLVLDDRPYAGYLYLAFGFHGRTEHRKDTWGFNIGIVGPLSFAEDLQKIAHEITNTPLAMGWEHQLENEPALELARETTWRLFRSKSGEKFGYDILPHIGGHIGNVNIDLYAGAEIRFGWNLPTNFGTCPIRLGCEIDNAASGESRIPILQRNRFGFHFFVDIIGRAVFHDIFLDGNTFKTSHHVDRNPYVAEMMAGFALEYGKMKMSYSYIFSTKTFETQDENQIFGSLSISMSY
jgi:hypothetical protein